MLFESYELADPGILIGLDATNGTVVSKKPIVWTVYGRNMACLNAMRSCIFYNFHICSSTPNNDEILQQIVKNLFSLENLGIMKTESNIDSREDQRTNQINNQ